MTCTFHFVGVLIHFIWCALYNWLRVHDKYRLVSISGTAISTLMFCLLGNWVRTVYKKVKNNCVDKSSETSEYKRI